MTQIDSLIEYLKSSKPFEDNKGFKLWEALKTLSDELVKLNKLVEENLVDNTIEIPTGTIDGANKLFLLSDKPFNNFIKGYKNGSLLLEDTDFTVEDNRIMFTVAPAALSVLQFEYSKRRII